MVQMVCVPTGASWAATTVPVPSAVILVATLGAVLAAPA